MMALPLCLTALSVKELFSMPNLNIPSCDFRPSPLVFSQLTVIQHKHPSCYHPPLCVIVGSNKVFPELLLFSSERAEKLLPIKLVLQTLAALLPFYGHTPGLQCLAVRGPTLNTATEVQLYQCQFREMINFLLLLPTLFLIQKDVGDLYRLW